MDKRRKTPKGGNGIGTTWSPGGFCAAPEKGLGHVVAGEVLCPPEKAQAASAKVWNVAQIRMGRCGRLEGGICIRLYSEEDFLSRPQFTAPELQRANLSDVILQMLAHRIGDVRTFPFLDPPTDQAVQGGVRQLQELGALDRNQRLTRLGRRMARMPLAPTVARMVLQADREGVLEDVVVVAAAISIQDPRERPIERKSQADEAHRQFVHPDSDFLTLANIWRAFRALGARPSSGQLRRFCKENFPAGLDLIISEKTHSSPVPVLPNKRIKIDNVSCSSVRSISKSFK